jgi:hypothetical protein
MLQAKGLRDCNATPTPHIDGHDTSDMKTDEDMINLKTYQSILGSCRFLADITHPETAYIPGIAGQYSHRPTAWHMQAIRRIIRCLAGATNSVLSTQAAKHRNLPRLRIAIGRHAPKHENLKLASFLPSIMFQYTEFRSNNPRSHFTAPRLNPPLAGMLAVTSSGLKLSYAHGMYPHFPQ